MILKYQNRRTDVRRELLRHWVNANSLSDTTTSRRYRVALYWAFTTMTTVGYGDIAIVNNAEKVAAMFAMIVGGACFGYIIGGVTSILENLNLSSTMHGEKMDAVKEYLYDRQYPPILATQVKRHFKFMYATGGVFDMTAILETLPASTAIDLVCACYGDLVHNTPFLRHADRGFVVAIAPNLFPLSGDDGEFLFFEGSVGTHLFFINSGVVSILANAETDSTPPGASNQPNARLDHPSAALPSLQCSEKTAKATSTSAGIACGTRGAGELLGDVAIMLTFANPFSTYVLHRAELYAVTKEALIDSLRDYETLRNRLLRAALEMRQHVHDCLAASTSKAASVPCPTTTAGTLSPFEEPASQDQVDAPLLRTVIEPLNGDESQPKSMQRVMSDASKIIAIRPSSLENEEVSSLETGPAGPAFTSVECKDDVLPYVASAEPNTLNKMAQLIRTKVPPVASVSTEQEHTKLGVLGQFRATTNAQVHPGFDHGDETERKLVPQINPSDLWYRHKVIHPELPAKVTWDVVVCSLIIYSIVSITYTIAFGVEEHACSWPRNGWTSDPLRPT